jgi:hypothetical protein
LTRLPAIGSPMLPSPMKPIFAMGASSRGTRAIVTSSPRNHLFTLATDTAAIARAVGPSALRLGPEPTGRSSTR